MLKCSKDLVPSVRVRRALTADIPALIFLEQQSPTAAHWNQGQYESAFASSDPLSPRLGWVAEVQEQPGISSERPALLGFLIAHRIDAEWELENIAVSAMARRGGVGTSLLSAFLQHVSAENGSAIFLEVRESNQSARGFYSKVGFEEIGVRKSYYSAPAEDAVLYLRRMS
jgi:[ribosomal protein S18]-alanine N-acetyltransferase